MKISEMHLPVICRSTGRSTAVKALLYGGIMTSQPGRDDVREQGARGTMSGSSAATAAASMSTCRQ